MPRHGIAGESPNGQALCRCNSRCTIVLLCLLGTAPQPHILCMSKVGANLTSASRYSIFLCRSCHKTETVETTTAPHSRRHVWSNASVHVAVMLVIGLACGNRAGQASRCSASHEQQCCAVVYALVREHGTLRHGAAVIWGVNSSLTSAFLGSCQVPSACSSSQFATQCDDWVVAHEQRCKQHHVNRIGESPVLLQIEFSPDAMEPAFKTQHHLKLFPDGATPPAGIIPLHLRAQRPTCTLH